jgi:hypothetical protein
MSKRRKAISDAEWTLLAEIGGRVLKLEATTDATGLFEQVMQLCFRAIETDTKRETQKKGGR